MDKQEFIRLAELYMDTVYRIARAGSRSDADAEDITQNTFLKLLGRKGSFNGDEHARRWLIKVAVNEGNMLWRKRKREDCFETVDTLSVPDDFTEKDHELMSALLKLPPKYRQVLQLYYFEDYSSREIAQLLSISDDTVRTRLSRARVMIKKELNHDSSGC